MCIFCTAVVNEKDFQAFKIRTAVTKEERLLQRKNLRRNRQRKERCKADDNFLITIPLSVAFLCWLRYCSLPKGVDFMPKRRQTARAISESARTAAGRGDTPQAMTRRAENGSSKTCWANAGRGQGKTQSRDQRKSAAGRIQSRDLHSQFVGENVVRGLRRTSHPAQHKGVLHQLHREPHHPRNWQRPTGQTDHHPDPTFLQRPPKEWTGSAQKLPSR